MRTSIIASFIAFAALSVRSHAAVVLAQYDFTSASSASTDADANSTAGPFGISGGVLGDTMGFSAAANVYFRASALTTSTDDAVTAGDYYSFTLTLNPGVVYDLTNLSVKFAGTNNNTPSNNFTGTLALRTSLNGFASNVGTPLATGSVAGPIDFSTVTPGVFDLSAFDDISTTVPVEFRLYVSLTPISSDPGNQIVRVDDVMLGGNLVPEPSVAVMGTVAAMGMLTKRRRK